MVYFNATHVWPNNKNCFIKYKCKQTHNLLHQFWTRLNADGHYLTPE